MWNNIGLKQLNSNIEGRKCLRMMWNNIGLKPIDLLAPLLKSLRMMWNNIGLKLLIKDKGIVNVWEWCEII